jgi:lipid-binding SYLF domain-containing protein
LNDEHVSLTHFKNSWHAISKFKPLCGVFLRLLPLCWGSLINTIDAYRRSDMKRVAIPVVTLFLTFSFSGWAHSGWDANEEKNANEALADFRKADPSMKAFFEKAQGYAVFPSVGKGAIGVGGAHGSGLVYEGGKPVGRTKLTQITIGLQLGGQSYREIIFFEDRATLDRFKGGNFEFSAQASAVAVKSGASADADFQGGVAVFTMAKGGLMFEASIGGQKFSFEPK